MIPLNRVQHFTYSVCVSTEPNHTFMYVPVLPTHPTMITVRTTYKCLFAWPYLILCCSVPSFCPINDVYVVQALITNTTLMWNGISLIRTGCWHQSMEGICATEVITQISVKGKFQLFSNCSCLHRQRIFQFKWLQQPPCVLFHLGIYIAEKQYFPFLFAYV